MSRLEEIKEIWDWDKANPLEAMSIDDLQWLIQQAERANKLKRDLDIATERGMKVAYTNIRYKQALKIIERSISIETANGVASQALGRESE